jgi:hypothetical protein
MTTVTYTASDDVGLGDGSAAIYTWNGLTTANNDGQPMKAAAWADRSVHVTGTWGAGGALVIEGSNNGGTTWVTLFSAQGAAISLSADALKQIVEVAALTRPRVTGGDGTTSLNVTLLARRANPMRT